MEGLPAPLGSPLFKVTLPMRDPRHGTALEWYGSGEQEPAPVQEEPVLTYVIPPMPELWE